MGKLEHPPLNRLRTLEELSPEMRALLPRRDASLTPCMTNVIPSRRTALVVEDDQLMLNLLHDVLAVAGFETTTVDSGSPVMALLAERHFDLLLVDVSLPDMNGLDICGAAWKSYQERIVILVITGLVIECWPQTSLQVCAGDFLGKPLDVDELIILIQRKLRGVPED